MSIMTFHSLGRSITKHLGLFAFGSIITGVIIGNSFRPESLKLFIPVSLSMMLYPMMLDIKLGDLGETLKRPRLLGIALIMNFALSPLIMIGLSYAFKLTASLSLVVGLFLYATIPCGGMVPAFTGMLNGNISLSIAIAASSYILCIGIVPLWTKLLIGEMLPVPLLLITKHLFAMIVIPMTLADMTRRITIKKKGINAFHNLKEQMKDFSSLGLIMLLFIIFILNGKLILNGPGLILKIVFPVFSFLTTLLICSTIICKIVQSSGKDSIAFTISVCAKNNALSLALALSVFGPDVGLVNAIAGPMAQFPFMLIWLKLARFMAYSKG